MFLEVILGLSLLFTLSISSKNINITLFPLVLCDIFAVTPNDTNTNSSNYIVAISFMNNMTVSLIHKLACWYFSEIKDVTRALNRFALNKIFLIWSQKSVSQFQYPYKIEITQNFIHDDKIHMVHLLYLSLLEIE